MKKIICRVVVLLISVLLCIIVVGCAGQKVYFRCPYCYNQEYIIPEDISEVENGAHECSKCGHYYSYFYDPVRKSVICH